jgi:prefoldin beta subunit
MVEPIRDPKALQAKIDEFQNIQRQLQILETQKQQVSLQLEELKMAKEELEKATGKVYKAAGNLLIETTVPEAKKQLSEMIETFEVRLAALGKQEEKVRTKSEEMRAELEKMVGKEGEAN